MGAEPHRLVTSHKITSDAGEALTLEVYGTRHRPSGRRIIVRRTDSGILMYDTDDCYDIANASNKLELWAVERGAVVPERKPEVAPQGPQEIAQGAGDGILASMTVEDVEASRKALVAFVPAECPF